MDILDDMGVIKLSAKVFFFKVNYFFKILFTEEEKCCHHLFTLKFQTCMSFFVLQNTKDMLN